MSRLIAYEFLSLDGYFSGPEGAEMDWVQRHFTRQIEEDIAEQYTRVEAFLMGRRTFDSLAGYWPTPAASDEHLVGPMNRMPKLVISHRPDVAAWPNSEHLGSDPVAEVPRRLAQGDGDVMIIGSGDIVRQLAQESLLDELRLLIFPEIVAEGRQLFDPSWHPASWVRTRCHAFAGGAVALHYRAPDSGSGSGLP